MARKSIKTKFGNAVEIEDEIGFPIGMRVESDNGFHTMVYLSIENAREISRALDAFATIHEPPQS